MFVMFIASLMLYGEFYFAKNRKIPTMTLKKPMPPGVIQLDQHKILSKVSNNFEMMFGNRCLVVCGFFFNFY